MARKPKLWDDLSAKTDNFAQCPYTLLLADHLPPMALKLYLIRWYDAFTKGKRDNGMHCSKLPQTKIAEMLNCTTRYVRKMEQLLHRHGYIYIQKKRRENIYYFTRKTEWNK